MTWINYCIIGQREQLGLDAVEQGFKITTRQIGSPDAPIE
jgi:hypothetical protein